MPHRGGIGRIPHAGRRTGWRHGASSGGLSGRSGKRRVADSLRRRRERRQRSRGHAPLVGQPERKRGHGSQTARGGGGPESSAPARRDGGDGGGSLGPS